MSARSPTPTCARGNVPRAYLAYTLIAAVLALANSLATATGYSLEPTGPWFWIHTLDPDLGPGSRSWILKVPEHPSWLVWMKMKACAWLRSPLSNP